MAVTILDEIESALTEISPKLLWEKQFARIYIPIEKINDLIVQNQLTRWEIYGIKILEGYENAIVIVHVNYPVERKEWMLKKYPLKHEGNVQRE